MPQRFTNCKFYCFDKILLSVRKKKFNFLRILKISSDFIMLFYFFDYKLKLENSTSYFFL